MTVEQKKNSLEQNCPCPLLRNWQSANRRRNRPPLFTCPGKLHRNHWAALQKTGAEEIRATGDLLAKPMLIGYARDSPHDQTLTIQQKALETAGCSKIFTDTSSDAKAQRKGLEKALSLLRPGDTLVVWKLDRLGSSIKELIGTMTFLAEQGIGFKSLTDNIDTTTRGGQQIFRTFAALQAVMKEKTTTGRQVARAKGRKGGRPKLLTPEEVKLLQELYHNKEVSIPEICQQLKISKTTLYRYVKPKEQHQAGLQGLVRRLRGLGER
jgi:DNA invertase Pin-like site-specific DNA recombinase